MESARYSWGFARLVDSPAGRSDGGLSALWSSDDSESAPAADGRSNDNNIGTDRDGPLGIEEYYTRAGRI